MNKVKQYGVGGGGAAILFLVYSHIGSIEGLSANMQLTGELVIAGLGVALAIMLQSRKPPEG